VLYALLLLVTQEFGLVLEQIFVSLLLQKLTTTKLYKFASVVVLLPQ
jgi:hypothetical protein